MARHAPVMVAEGMCYGRQEVPLRPGWERLTAGLSVLAQGASCQVVYSSPAARCRDMAEKLVKTTCMELRIDPRLAELDFGEWEGQCWSEISRIQLDAWAADPAGFAPPGGESGLSLMQRITAVWQDIKESGVSSCILSHGGPLRLLTGLAAGEKPQLLSPSIPQGFARLFSVI
nr:histidine phosphatase family protein [Acetobacter thailandicus]